MKATTVVSVSLAASVLLTAPGTASEAAALSPHPVKSDFAGVALNRIGGSSTLTFYSIKAKWIEPRVRPRGYHDARSQAFIAVNDVNGFYGGPQDDVPEIGTRADSIGGKPVYKAFYYTGFTSCEPDSYCPPIWIKESVRPGDHMAASITVSRSYQKTTLKLTDTRYYRGRKPQTWTKTFREYGPLDAGEAVTVGAGQADGEGALADFGAIVFTDVTINGNVIGSYLPDFGTQDYDLSGRVVATVSPFTVTGEGFTVRWVRTNG